MSASCRLDSWRERRYLQHVQLPSSNGVDWKWRTAKIAGYEFAGHEIDEQVAGREIAGHKNARHEIAGHENAAIKIAGQKQKKY